MRASAARTCSVLTALFACFCLLGCRHESAPPPTHTLTVLAAASLSDAFHDIAAAFEAAHPGVKVQLSLAGSNQLRAQLEQGGPGDVFASADRKQMDAAASNVNAATIRVFARNSLALIIPKANPGAITLLTDVARPKCKLVVADAAVPVGNYTRLMLEKARSLPQFGPAFVQGFEANVVSREQSVAGVVSKVALAEVDAGIAYASDASGKQDRIALIEIPAPLAQQADYVAAVTARATDPALAAAFLDFLTSPSSAQALRARGFTPPETGTP